MADGDRYYRLEVDWEGDGQFGGAYDDITSYVLAAEPITTRRGKDYASQLVGRSSAGSLSCKLLNTDGRFSPNNASSPLTGKLLPGRAVRLRSRGYPDALLADDPILLWRLGEASGSVAVDETGRNDGTYTTVTYGQTGPLANDPNGAVKCQQTGTYHLIRSSPLGLSASVVSVSAWVKIHAHGNWHNLVAHNWRTAGAWILYTNASGQVFFGVSPDGATEYNSHADGLSTDTWYHLTGVYDGATVTLYVDGVAATPTALVGATLDTTNPIAVNTAANGSGFTIAEIAVFPTALTANQVAAHYAARTRWTPGPLWAGYLDAAPHPTAEVGGFPAAELRASGPLVRLARDAAHVRLPALVNARTDEAVAAVLDAAGWPPDARSLGRGMTVLARWYPTGQPALDALRELEDAELGEVAEGADGSVVFRGRHYRETGARRTSQQTYTDAGGDIGYVAIEEDDPLDQIYNEVEATVALFDDAGAAATLWTRATPLELEPFAVAELLVTYGGADAYATEWIDPDPDVGDVEVNGIGVDIDDLAIALTDQAATSALLTLSNFNASRPLTVTRLALRGWAATRDDPAVVTAESVASINRHGRRRYDFASPWLPSERQAQAFADYVIACYAEPRAIFRLTIVANRDATHYREAVLRELGDRITLTATGTRTKLGVSGAYHVESIAHRIQWGGRHEVTLELSPASTADLAVWDTSEWGDGSTWGF